MTSWEQYTNKKTAQFFQASEAQWAEMLKKATTSADGLLALKAANGWVQSWTQDNSDFEAKIMPPLTSQDVERAIELLEEKGWAQGAYVESTGQMCTLGAIRQARYERGVHSFNDSLLSTELAPLMGLSDVGSIPIWNDTLKRTVDEVIEALTLAAKKLRDMGR